MAEVVTTIDPTSEMPLSLAEALWGEDKCGMLAIVNMTF
jgi:hypothetical protein